jgi:hypothetical protein
MTEPRPSADPFVNKKRLWRRYSSAYVVEIRVGNAWTTHFKTEDPEKAKREAESILNDLSVSAVKIQEHEIEHVCSAVWEKERAIIQKIPPTMTDTGKYETCPSCQTPRQKIAYDGHSHWLFCGECKRANPIRM